MFTIQLFFTRPSTYLEAGICISDTLLSPSMKSFFGVTPMFMLNIRLTSQRSVRKYFPCKPMMLTKLLLFQLPRFRYMPGSSDLLPVSSPKPMLGAFPVPFQYFGNNYSIPSANCCELPNATDICQLPFSGANDASSLLLRCCAISGATVHAVRRIMHSFLIILFSFSFYLFG